MRQPAKQPLSFHLVRLSLGIVFFHFGFLKFFPDLSQAEMLSTQTIIRISPFEIDARTALWWLALGECTIGLFFLFNICIRLTAILFLAHMIGTFAPLFVLPELAFTVGPLGLTFEGQYVMKNLVFLAAGWSVFWPCFQKTVPQRNAVNNEVTLQGTASIS